MTRFQLRRKLSALRPRVGRKLPEAYRLGNVGRLAREVAEDVRSPSFVRLLAQIDGGASIHRGNRVELFVSGETAFRAMRGAIDGARDEVLLESYILRDDQIGHEFFHGLREAAGRGVTVRVLVDDYGSQDTGDGFWQEVRESGIELRFFHPVWSNLLNSAYRDHRKILVVDRSTAFTGGMNIGNEYGDSRGAVDHPWRDTHARVVGSAAREMALVFAEGWLRAGGDELRVDGWNDLEGDGDAQVLILESRPSRGHAESASALAAIAGLARERLWITNAYFAPRRSAIRVLREAAGRGVDVRLLLPAWTDAPFVRHAGHGWYAALLEGGVRIFEYERALLHAKTLVADGFASVIGSTNLDFRSFHFNAECNLVILDEVAGTILEDEFDRDLATSHEIHPGPWHERPIRHKVADRVCRWLAPLL